MNIVPVTYEGQHEQKEGNEHKASGFCGVDLILVLLAGIALCVRRRHGGIVALASLLMNSFPRIARTRGAVRDALVLNYGLVHGCTAK